MPCVACRVADRPPYGVGPAGGMLGASAAAWNGRAHINRTFRDAVNGALTLAARMCRRAGSLATLNRGPAPGVSPPFRPSPARGRVPACPGVPRAPRVPRCRESTAALAFWRSSRAGRTWPGTTFYAALDQEGARRSTSPRLGDRARGPTQCRGRARCRQAP